MRFFLPSLTHVFPLVPLALGKPYVALAAALFVVVSYIKVFKLRAIAQALENHQAASTVVAAEIKSVRAAQRRWHRLTFLSPEAL